MLALTRKNEGRRPHPRHDATEFHLNCPTHISAQMLLLYTSQSRIRCRFSHSTNTIRNADSSFFTNAALSQHQMYTKVKKTKSTFYTAGLSYTCFWEKLNFR